jgi:hypothetical protein
MVLYRLTIERFMALVVLRRLEYIQSGLCKNPPVKVKLICVAAQPNISVDGAKDISPYAEIIVILDLYIIDFTFDQEFKQVNFVRTS